MFPANITRDEARLRSASLTTQTYEVLVDLSGRLPDGSPLPDADATFWTTTKARFSSSAARVRANLIAERIIRASLDGEELAPEAFDGEHLALDLTDGEHELEVTAVMRFSRTGEGLHRFVDPADGRTYLYSQFEVADARRMFPTFEQPDLKATFQFTVVAPDHWTVLSNSPAVDPEPRGDGFATWRFAPPHASPPTSPRSAPASSTPSTTPMCARTAPHPPVGVGATVAGSHLTPTACSPPPNAASRSEPSFGARYPFGDYAQVFVPEFNFGAMENAGCVVLRDEYIFTSKQTAASYESRDNTILHEMAHMWFGDLVTMTWWDDLWLNESFAEWASHFAQAEIRARYADRPDPWATFCNARKTWAYRQDQLPSTHPIAADMVDLEAVELNFDGITYAKGVRPAAAGGVRRPGAFSPGSGTTSPSTPGATPNCRIFCRNWRRRPGATCRSSPASGCRPPG